MSALSSLDDELVRFDREVFSAQELGQVMALQSGAFITAPQHAKFDTTKTPT